MTHFCDIFPIKEINDNLLIKNKEEVMILMMIYYTVSEVIQND